MFPVKLKIQNKNQLFIRWDDESENVIGLETLRKVCPCATCLTERERQSKTYIPVFTKNQLEIADIKQVGSYALSFTWKDGHNTGIYEYTFLKRLTQS